MITIGVDAHKTLHAATVLDERGQVLGHRQEANSAQGWATLLHWAEELSGGEALQWGIEEAAARARNALEHYIEFARQDNVPLPQPLLHTA